jgi:antitoxin MazE
MKTRVQRWGNSLAVRIPKAFAAEVGLADDTPVEIKVNHGALIVEPSNTVPSLVELLSGISKANIHAEFDTGRPVGNEVW